MKSILRNLLSILIPAALLAALPVNAQQLDTLGISEVNVNPAVAESVRGAGKLNEMNRVLEALDGQLIDRMNTTRKFQVVRRSDLPSILREQDLVESGLIEAGGDAAESFQISGVKYLLVPVVDDFQDYVETAEFEAIGQRAQRRVVRFSMVARIYDSTTGTLLESANFQISNRDVTDQAAHITRDGDLSDELLVAITRKMADRIALHVIDYTHPALVVARTGEQVTINRGDGGGMERGQSWEVFAVGEELIDPGTGMSLGREEVPVGEVTITRVTPLTSTAQIQEDYGIERLHVLRRKD